MKNINERIDRLQKLMQGTGYDVVIAEQQSGGMWKIVMPDTIDRTYTMSELEQFAADYGAQTLILDDIGRNDDE